MAISIGMDTSVRWLTGAMFTGLALGAVGLVLFETYLHPHQICVAPYGAAITVAHPAPSPGDCSLKNALFYVGIVSFALGAVLALGSTAIRLRRR
jgi:hypothetical protein